MEICKYFLYFLFLLLYSSGLMAQSTIYSDGARIVSQSGTFRVIDDGNFPQKSESATDLAPMANLKIETDASLKVIPVSYLTVSGDLTNNSDIERLIMQDDSSLLHNYTSGPSTIQLYISGSSTLSDNCFELIFYDGTKL